MRKIDANLKAHLATGATTFVARLPRISSRNRDIRTLAYDPVRREIFSVDAAL